MVGVSRFGSLLPAIVVGLVALLFTAMGSPAGASGGGPAASGFTGSAGRSGRCRVPVRRQLPRDACRDPGPSTSTDCLRARQSATTTRLTTARTSSTTKARPRSPEPTSRRRIPCRTSRGTNPPRLEESARCRSGLTSPSPRWDSSSATARPPRRLRLTSSSTTRLAMHSARRWASPCRSGTRRSSTSRPGRSAAIWPSRSSPASPSNTQVSESSRALTT